MRFLALFCGLMTWSAVSTATPIQRLDNGLPASAQAYSFTWTEHIADPNSNRAGQFPITDTEQTATPEIYGAACVPRESCGEISGVYFRATTGNLAGAPVATGSDGLQFYKLNENLGVGVRVNAVIGGNATNTAFVNVPVDNYRSNATFKKPPYSVKTGSKVRLSLYIIKPFLGKVVIDPTLVSQIYASTASGDFGGVPLAEVIIQGLITVDQSCNFSAGTILPTVDFGSMPALDASWKTRGSGPAGKAQKINLNIQCDNLPDAKFRMKLQGTPDPASPDYLATGNSDVGIKFLDDQNALIRPTTAGTIFPATPIPFDYSDPLHPTGSTSITVAPVSTTGKEPNKGTYTATATIGIQLE